MKYATLRDLKAAYDSGELSADNWLMLDNDTAGVYDHDAEWVKVEKVFEMHPEEIIEQALDLLGIPHGHV